MPVTCKASRTSLSEISVAKDLAPEVLKVAWMILFLSLSSCEQRQAGSQSRPPLREAFQTVGLSSLFTALGNGSVWRGRRSTCELEGARSKPRPRALGTQSLRLSTTFFFFLIEEVNLYKKREKSSTRSSKRPQAILSPRALAGPSCPGGRLCDAPGEHPASR